jgi:hypothetical protein
MIRENAGHLTNVWLCLDARQVIGSFFKFRTQMGGIEVPPIPAAPASGGKKIQKLASAL